MKKIFFLFTLLSLFGLLLSNSSEINELKFSHKYHVLGEEIECETCHEPANKSVTGKDNLLPTMETCADCHDIEDVVDQRPAERQTELILSPDMTERNNGIRYCSSDVRSHDGRDDVSDGYDDLIGILRIGFTVQGDQ